MSKTTWTVDIDNADSGGGSWSVITAPGQPAVQVHGSGHSALAERIARLLTEEDEKIAHNGHFDRAWSLWESNGCQSPNEAWQAWWDGICARRPSFILSQLEAAYRAATEAEQ